MQERHCKSPSRVVQTDAARAPLSGGPLHAPPSHPSLQRGVCVMIKRSSTVLAAVAVTMAVPLVAQAQSNALWEGFYAGVNAGGLWGSTSASIGENGTGGGFNGTGSGFVGGAQAGYNYLLGPVLLGAEVDFQGSTISSGLGGGAGPSAINTTATMPWFSTFRVRAGYTFGSVMPYVKIGRASCRERAASSE